MYSRKDGTPSFSTGDPHLDLFAAVVVQAIHDATYGQHYYAAWWLWTEFPQIAKRMHVRNPIRQGAT